MRHSISHRLLPLLLGALVAAGRAPAAAPDEGTRWAVLVGVDDYTFAEKLRYCSADQRALRERLVSAGFPEKQVFLLEDGAKASRFRPLRSNIDRQIDAVLKLAAEEDLVVLGFSGHGTQIGKSMYLVPGDGDPDDADTLVSLDAIYDRLQDCAASTKLVIVDACRNEPARGGRRSLGASEGARALSRSLREKRLPTGTILFNSCAPGEVSWEEAEFGHGVFMHYVLEGLAGRADGNGDGRLSINELSKYATHETKTYVLNERSVTQRPYMRNEGEADMLDFALLPVAMQVVENSIGMGLVRIPAGEFEMGVNGQKTHRARITRPFLMGRTEVTQGQWAKVMGTTPWRGEKFVREGENFAASWVSWEDAVEFCRKLTEIERRAGRVPADRSYRLPTEAEWEYACRAGTTTRFSFGDDESRLGDYAWWGGLNGGKGNAKTEQYPHEVGRKEANPWHLFDMHGNVSEWCANWYEEESARPSPATSSIRMIRGGFWGLAEPKYDESGMRGCSHQTSRNGFLGFRVACELE